MASHHEIEIQVRDYELDVQGIVNNSVYLNYLEHARHEFLKTLDLDFKKLHDEGWDPVVTRTEIDYKKSLTSGDLFKVITTTESYGNLRIIFNQEIRRLRDEAIIAKAKVTVATLKNGRPSVCPPIRKAFLKS